jgi:peptidoglycan/xylan/chitin deacetylase (PgdA/CDA1 family)
LGLTKLKRIDPNPITLFRPPYGAYNNDTKVITEEHKMSMDLWNEDPRDWSTTVPTSVAYKVLSEVHSGSINVMHDRPSTIKALPDIIAGIDKKGLKLVIISS